MNTFSYFRPLVVLKSFLLVTSSTKKDDNGPIPMCSGRRRYLQVQTKDLGLTTKESRLKSTIASICQKIEHDLLLVRGAPGVVVGVSHKRELLWKAGLGYSDVENLVPCHPDCVMRVASISKTITMCTIVAKMLEDGRLKLDDSIHEYLTEDEFPKQKFLGKECDIKLRHLLSNTSGIRHYGQTPNVPEGSPKLMPINWPTSMKIFQSHDYFNRDGNYSGKIFRNVIDSLEIFKNDDLVCSPGSEYVYSTQGWVLVSAVVQKALQKSTSKGKESKNFEDALLSMIRNELGLENILLELEEPMIMFRAKNYQRSGMLGRLVNTPAVHLSNKWSGGGMLANVEDLVKLGSMLIDCYKSYPGAYLKSETVQQMWKDHTNGRGYGLGFMVPPSSEKIPRSEFYVFHTGRAVGCSSILMIYPDLEFVVSIIVNLEDINLKSLSHDIVKAFQQALKEEHIS